MKMKTLFKSISLMLVAVLSAFAPQDAAAQGQTVEQRSQEITRRAAVKAQSKALYVSASRVKCARGYVCLICGNTV